MPIKMRGGMVEIDEIEIDGLEGDDESGDDDDGEGGGSEVMEDAI